MADRPPGFGLRVKEVWSASLPQKRVKNVEARRSTGVRCLAISPKKPASSQDPLNSRYFYRNLRTPPRLPSLVANPDNASSTRQGERHLERNRNNVKGNFQKFLVMRELKDRRRQPDPITHD
jgi:hypothetical protein